MNDGIGRKAGEFSGYMEYNVCNKISGIIANSAGGN